MVKVFESKQCELAIPETVGKVESLFEKGLRNSSLFWRVFDENSFVKKPAEFT